MLRSGFIAGSFVKSPDTHISLRQARGILLTIAQSNQWYRLHNPEVLRVLTKLHVHRDGLRILSETVYSDARSRLDVFFCMWTLGQLSYFTKIPCGVAVSMIVSHIRLNPSSYKPKGSEDFIVIITLLICSLICPQHHLFIAGCLSNVDLLYEGSQMYLKKSRITKISLRWCMFVTACTICLGSLTRFDTMHVSFLISVAVLSIPLKIYKLPKEKDLEQSWILTTGHDFDSCEHPKHLLSGWIFID